jgi:hypothetical protein
VQAPHQGTGENLLAAAVGTESKAGLIRPEDVANEEYVRGMLEQAWRCSIVRMPKFSPYDFYAHRDGQLTAILEIKTRYKVYSTVFLSLRKYVDIRRAACAAGVPCLFVVNYPNDGGIFFYRVTDDLSGVLCTIAGRSDRGRDESEPCLLIPFSHMTPLNGGPCGHES